jgi:hypothetical protein
MTKNYAKIGPIELTAWQWEIYGCIPFYGLSIASYLLGGIFLWFIIPFMLIGKVNGYYDHEYY